MATLASFQGKRAFTLTYQSQTLHLRAGDVERIVDSMSNDMCREYHLAARQHDTATAQRLFMEAAVLFYSAPAAPAASLAWSQPRQNRNHAVACTI